MKAIILAGGYAKRLWPLTKDTPKPLLEVGGKPIIDYIVEKIESLGEISSVIVSTNAKFGKKFRQWQKKHDVKLVIEPSQSEGKKLGSIGGLNYVLSKAKINDDFLLVGGDNIFEFDLGEFVRFYRKVRKTSVALYDIRSKKKVKGRYGVCIIDKKKVSDFQEKPEKPASTLVSTACYIFPKRNIRLIKKYLDEGNNPDALGFFLKWLCSREEIYAYVFRGKWFDIGSFEALAEAKKHYSR